jgi:uncharacterized protein YdeI (BOF family)
MLVAMLLVPLGLVRGLAPDAPDHLVVSEVVTGGASASDELIEIYNPTAAPMPIEGLEVVYVTASGATVSRRAAWGVGTPEIGPGGHLLLANEAGIYAPIADAVYASGMAATGGSVALRIQGATSAIDAVGWGTAASTWLEGSPAVVASAGSSIERLPGGAMGSTTDTDDNAADFVERLLPDPQNAGSPPTPVPGGTPVPTAEPSAAPTLAPSSQPSAEPTPMPTAPGTASPTPEANVISIAAARSSAEGAVVTIEGIALTGSAFHDGGGYVADSTAGIAVLLTDGAFDAGRRLRITGTIDDRFAQRTLRAGGAAVADLGSETDPEPVPATTGGVGEALEGGLVRVGATILGAPTELSAGVAFDVDDGSGPSRIVVWTATAVDTSTWVPGAGVDVVGVVGQRDSSGTGAAGYRVQPRGAFDVGAVTPPASSTPAPSAGASGTAAPSASADPSTAITIARAREAAKNARVTVRGVVTLPTGIVDTGSAAIQDASGAILLRLSEEARPLALGEVVEVSGARSTKSGMETIRLTTESRRIGTELPPAARPIRTGDAGESHEALRVVVRGSIVAAPRQSSTGTVSFEVDDGSGPLRVVVGSGIGLDAGFAGAGSWVEVVGVLGQETSGSQPTRGYRVWPARAADLQVVAEPPTDGSEAEAAGAGEGEGSGAAAGLGGIDDGTTSGLVVGASLVAGPWEELGIAGLLWDGRRLVGVDPASAEVVSGLPGAVPMLLELTGARMAGRWAALGLDRVALGRSAGQVVRGEGEPHAPAVALPNPGSGPAWVSLVGAIAAPGGDLTLTASTASVSVERRCDDGDAAVPSGMVRALGIGLAGPARIVVGCDGITRASALEIAALARGGRAPSTALATAPPEVETDGGRQLVVAALLGVASLALAGSAVHARLTRDDPPAAGAEDADEDPPAGALDAVTSDGPEPRHLTLVPAPRERASP